MSQGATVKGSAEMWELSKDKQTVRLTVPPVLRPVEAGTPLRVEFDIRSLEATLAMLVQMHFEMIRLAPAEVSGTKH